MTKKNPPAATEGNQKNPHLNFMSSTPKTPCTVRVPFDLRLTIQLHTSEEYLEEATVQWQESDRCWGHEHRTIHRWLNQEIVPNLLKRVREIAPHRELEAKAAWITGVKACRSYVTDITYVADEAGYVN